MKKRLTTKSSELMTYISAHLNNFCTILTRQKFSVYIPSHLEVRMMLTVNQCSILLGTEELAFNIQLEMDSIQDCRADIQSYTRVRTMAISTQQGTKMNKESKDYSLQLINYLYLSCGRHIMYKTLCTTNPLLRTVRQRCA